MREVTRNKAERPAHTTGLVERFPRREGGKIVMDRPLTPEEVKARNEERELLNKARAFRQRKKA